jgi:IQ calmodulin-binding motif
MIPLSTCAVSNDSGYVLSSLPPSTELQRWCTSYARNAAATILQAHVRGKQQRSKQAVTQQWRSHQLRSVLRLQAVGRGWVGRRHAQQQLRAKVTFIAYMYYTICLLYTIHYTSSIHS